MKNHFGMENVKMLDPMTKMWISFGAIGALLLASGIISFARAKTRGVLRAVLSVVAFVTLIFGVLCGIVSIA
jgi:hypothetical protein